MIGIFIAAVKTCPHSDLKTLANYYKDYGRIILNMQIKPPGGVTD